MIKATNHVTESLVDSMIVPYGKSISVRVGDVELAVMEIDAYGEDASINSSRGDSVLVQGGQPAEIKASTCRANCDIK